MRSVGIAVAVMIAGCSPSTRPGGGGGGSGSGSIDAAGSGSGSGSSGVCFEPSVTGTAQAGNTAVQDCAIWNNVANMTGDVTLTRSGNDFTMAFANGLTFAGTVTGNQVTLTHVEPHTFTDGCGWQSTETLTGTIDPATCVLSLAYNYEEMVVQDNGGCATPCTGSADVTLMITPIVM